MNTINPVWLILLTGFVAMLPVLIGVFTSYIKVSIVLSMLKSGFGAQQIPGQMVVMILSLATTLYVMSPVISETGSIAAALDYSSVFQNPSPEKFSKFLPLFSPWKAFISKHAGERELSAVVAIEKRQEKTGEPADAEITRADQPIRILVLAYVLSELKEAFAMGFVLLLPFLVIDMVVANILAGLGMVMVSPMLISLPLKVILFILADGWLILTRSLILSYQL